MSQPDLETDDLLGGQEKQPGGFDIKALVQTAIRFWYLVVIAVSIALVGAFFYIKSMLPLYRSTAEMKVDSRSATPGLTLQGSGTTTDSGGASEDLATTEHSFLNATLMERVVARLGLTERPNFAGPHQPAGSLSKEDLVGYLLGNSDVSLIPGTRLIEVSFQNWNPETAMEVTNAIVSEGIKYDRDQRVAAVTANVAYLDQEANRLEAELRSDEEKQNAYVRSLGISVDEELDLVSKQLNDVNLKYAESKYDTSRLEADYEQIKTIRSNTEKLLSIKSVRDVPAILSLVDKVNGLKGNLAKLRERYRDQNPFILQAQMEIKEMQDALNQEILLAPQTVEVALEMARRNEKSLADEQAKMEQKALQVRDWKVQMNVYQRQIDADRLAYETALKRKAEEMSQERSQPVLLQVVSPAGPAVRSTVQPRKVYATSLLGGLMVGFGLIFLIAQMSSGIKGLEDAERSLDLSVLAAVPKYTPPKEGVIEDWERALAPALRANCPILSPHYSRLTEAFRSLRTFLQIKEMDAKGHAVLLTSPAGQEGVSFCALNLAVAMAQAGYRTLLIDADLRKPSLEDWILGSNGHFGLSDYLVGDTAFSSIIRPCPISNLDLIPAGSRSWHSAELLGRPQFKSLVNEAQDLYDWVVVNGSPVTSVSDTLSFARLFPLLCLVLRTNKTSRTVARRAVELLARSGARVTGLVLNFVPVANRDDYDGALGVLPIESVEAQAQAFPVRCPSCGRSYSDEKDFLARTQADATAESSQEGSFVRRCVCGAPLVMPGASRRDYSTAGQQRREVFDDLLGRMIRAGLDRNEARTRLLLLLKIWRNEVSADLSRDTSLAARRRKALFDEVVGLLERDGLDRDAAGKKLLTAVQVWRDAR